MKMAVALTVACICLTGCAGLDMRAPATQADAKGFRYFETSPFLLVYTDGKGGIVSKFLYLPDTTKLRSIYPYAYGAKNDVTLKFDKGRLVQAAATVDETIIPASVIAGLEKIAVSKAAANAGEAGIPAPYLFRIVSDGSGNWQLRGGQAVKNGQPLHIVYE